MKKILLICALVSALVASSQTISKYRFEPAKKPQISLKETAPALTSGHILYAAPMIGLTPVELQKVNGTWTTTATLNPLFAYGIGVGEYSTDAQGNYVVQPYVGLNAFLSGGITANLQGSFQIGGLLTIYKWFGAGGGYDIATHNAFLCTTLKFDLPVFSQGAAFTRIKTFR